ncbi:hypothetical protein [Sporomusa sp.]|uniref:hypothetical protein n=1 Tax=Sporomusa sp. TaxID=2078658 RepID=UPI002BAF3901|nr:hypothetical protein [Sporomusa sp.]HWR44860.1 hypothetical protein [Sporomusa sp.]
MPVAPTPPTKPTPPVAPAFTPSRSNTASDLNTASPANSTQNLSKPVSPEVSGTAKKLEGLGEAFQGKATQTKGGEKAEPAATEVSKTNSIQAAPIASFDSQNGVSSQTTVPTKPPAMDSKPSSLSYVPFIGIMGVIVVILLGIRVFKMKTKQPRTLIDYSKRSTTVMNKEGIDIVVSPQTTAPKVKRNFELRV